MHILFANKMRSIFVIRQRHIFILIFAVLNIIILLPWRHSCVLKEFVSLEDIPYELVKNTDFTLKGKDIPLCPLLPENEFMFPMPGIYSKVTENDLLSLKSELKIQKGGHWKPSECFPQISVAVIVPYRDRPEQLNAFILYMHHFLNHQNLNYTVYIIEQSPEKPFNRGLLLNIGFKEASQLSDHGCFVFQDVDLLPENTLNIYGCSSEPRHMAVALNTFRYNLPYCGLFGGAVAFTKGNFENINGFANRFFGWGGEDDDLFDRVKDANYHIQRWDPKISKYFMLPHKKEQPNNNRFSLLKESLKYKVSDGLTNLNYKRLNYEPRDLYTWILVQV